MALPSMGTGAGSGCLPASAAAASQGLSARPAVRGPGLLGNGSVTRYVGGSSGVPVPLPLQCHCSAPALGTPSLPVPPSGCREEGMQRESSGHGPTGLSRLSHGSAGPTGTCSPPTAVLQGTQVACTSVMVSRTCCRDATLSFKLSTAGWPLLCPDSCDQGRPLSEAADAPGRATHLTAPAPVSERPFSGKRWRSPSSYFLL